MRYTHKKEIKVLRKHIAYGYYFDIYQTIDGDRAITDEEGNPISPYAEIYCGKIAFPVKSFEIQANLSEDDTEEFENNILSTYFVKACLDFYNNIEKVYDTNTVQAVLPIDPEPEGERVTTFKTIRYYCEDEEHYVDVEFVPNYYNVSVEDDDDFDDDEGPVLFENDEEDEGMESSDSSAVKLTVGTEDKELDEELPVVEVWYGKINSIIKYQIGIVQVDTEKIDDYITSEGFDATMTELMKVRDPLFTDGVIYEVTQDEKNLNEVGIFTTLKDTSAMFSALRDEADDDAEDENDDYSISF